MNFLSTSTDLALFGGEPVRSDLLPYGRQSLTEDDLQAVLDVLRSDWITTGPKIDEFEEVFAAYVGAKYAVSFSSGTAALHGAVVAAGVERGHEVITTPLTFCATANSVLYQQAIPKFADVTEDTLTLDPSQVERLISSETKAILPVDYAGHPAELDELHLLADREGVVVIEDAAHALGGRYRGRSVGSISHMTVFSFHPVKHLTTGEGGMVTTDNEAFARQLRSFRNHGIEADVRARKTTGQWYYEMNTLGYNYRLTDIGCALGLSQMPRLNKNIERRREIAALYREHFQGWDALCLPFVRADSDSSWHLYPVRINLKVVRGSRDEIFQALRAEGIGVNVHYIPVYLHPYYQERFDGQDTSCPVAERSYKELISLPMFQSMTDEDVQDVVTAVGKVIQYFS
tara:strand:- start:3334 stop:4539 length:1206 start_codon:yes stop_codon:yes gene_type:complete